MKKQKFLAARTTLLALTCAALLAIPTISARAQSSDGILDVLDQIRQRQAQALEGAWIFTVSPAVPSGVTPPPPFRVYTTFSRGGASIGSDRSRPLDGPQHGVWQHLGGNEFATSIIQDRFDAMGNFLGTFTARTNATITGPDTLVGVASVEFRDPAGNITLARCATLRGERFKLQPLAAQCQSITPPQ